MSAAVPGEAVADPRPAVARAVHYVARGSLDGKFPPACRAATITQAGAWVVDEIAHHEGGRTRVIHESWDDDAVHLHVANPTGVFLDGPMVYDPGQAWTEASTVGPLLCDGRTHEPGSWHWPARV